MGGGFNGKIKKYKSGFEKQSRGGGNGVGKEAERQSGGRRERWWEERRDVEGGEGEEG